MSKTRTLSLVLQTPGCLAPFVIGDFGTGKTTQVLQMCDTLGWDRELLRPGERGEGAFGVVPVPSEDRRTLNYPIPDWAARLMASEKPSLVFIDEATSIPPALQPPIRGLVLDGIIGGERLPARVRRCAAGTPVDQAAGGWDMAPDLANRFIYLDWPSPTASEWTGWLCGHADNADVIHLDMEAWEKEWASAKALGAAFIRSHPACLHEDVAKVLGRTPPAFSTPRTWESALRLLASCRAANCMDLYPQLAQGCLGPAVSLEGTDGKPGGAWLVWLKDNDLPDPEDLLADPEQFVHDPRRPDRTYATLLAVAEAGIASGNGKKFSPKVLAARWESAFAIMDKALSLKIGKDVVLMPSRILTSDRRPKGIMPGPICQKVSQVMCDLWDVIKCRS